MGKSLTKRQREILKHIESFYRENDIPPSVRDIARLHQCSVKGAYDHILALEKKGYIQRSARRSRSIIFTELARQVLRPMLERRIPVLGRIAAGKPVLAEENYEDFCDFPLDEWERSNYRFFALRIEGDSMQDAGILDGDIGIFRFQQSAASGKIVVAVVEEEATVKYYFRDGRHNILRAANPAYPDMIVQDLQIRGIMRGLIRPQVQS
ncbi:MAG: repressor LexA [Candidatus Riflebacteria bacterium RBG_13_59_9]|nr:MAG: repressor LexA [Candidatus Riflebacteria bacterium RBG_13_59_9]